jgi:tetratricopeptide (TPR) repeat protein
MKTKEIAFMLPAMLTLYEMIFFKGNMKKRILYLIPFLLSMLIIPQTLLSIDKPVEDIISDAGAIRGGTQLPRGEYLLAQFRVLVTYLRLIFLPLDQNLDYDYPRYSSFFNTEVFSSFLFLVTLLGLSIYTLFRYKDSAPHSRIVSFGIMWFFVNLLIESSVIPLDNVIYDHRMYLPSVGVYLAVTTSLYMITVRLKRRREWMDRAVIGMFAVVTVVLSGTTYARNMVWRDEVRLWEDVVSKSPGKSRSHYNLGVAYDSKGMTARAIEHFSVALRINPDSPEAHNNIGVVYMSTGAYDVAINHYQIALSLKPGYAEASKNLAIALRSKGQ